MVDLFRFHKWDLVSKRGMYYIISIVLVVISLFSLLHGGLNLGIDFKGGGLVTYTVSGRIPDSNRVVDIVRTKLAETGDEKLRNADVQIASSSTNDQFVIHTPLGEDASDQDAIFTKQVSEVITPVMLEIAADNNFKILNDAPDSQEVVSGTISREFMTSAVVASVVGMILIMFWIWIRYNISGGGFRYSTAGIIALVQNLIILLGFFAVFRNYFQINSSFIAALLTVLGFTIHDTIIIFDRIRENIRLMKGKTFAETVNISILETLSRSVNTVLTLLLTLFALLLFGGVTIRDIAVAMIVGVVAGAFSSIFIASQLLVSWAKPDQKSIDKDHLITS